MKESGQPEGRCEGIKRPGQSEGRCEGIKGSDQPEGFHYQKNLVCKKP